MLSWIWKDLLLEDGGRSTYVLAGSNEKERKRNVFHYFAKNPDPKCALGSNCF